MIVYEKSSGRILYTAIGYVPAETATVGVLDGAGDPDTHRVVAGRVVERAPSGVAISATTLAADGASELVVSGLPPGAVVTFAGGRYTVTDGEFRATTLRPGRYLLSVDPWPARTETRWIDAR